MVSVDELSGYLSISGSIAVARPKSSTLTAPVEVALLVVFARPDRPGAIGSVSRPSDLVKCNLLPINLRTAMGVIHNFL